MFHSFFKLLLKPLLWYHNRLWSQAKGHAIRERRIAHASIYFTHREVRESCRKNYENSRLLAKMIDKYQADMTKKNTNLNDK